MGQEFVIKSTTLEDKINQLLPSQGGQGAGIDLSASTTIIPIIDLTESAEGSNQRQDLQTALSFGTTTAFDITNTTTTIVNTTGFFRVFGVNSMDKESGAVDRLIQFVLNDGTTDKIIYKIDADYGSATNNSFVPFDFVIYLTAGHSFKILAQTAFCRSAGATRQIADLQGNLISA